MPMSGHGARADGSERPAVTVALAKRQKLNAVKISDEILAKLDELKKTQIPSRGSMSRSRGTTGRRPTTP